MDRTPSTLVIGPYLKLHSMIYKATNGAIGKHLAGTPSLMLTTTGHKSGLPRTVVLSYMRDGDDWVVVASNGGSDRAPAWLTNLSADPAVTVQDGRTIVAARARVASDAERARLWPLVNRNNRGLSGMFHRGATGRYDVYQRHTARPIPIVILSRA